MIKSAKYLKIFVGVFLILLQVSNSSGEDLLKALVKIYSKKRYKCAGTLIRNDVVITSAECLVGETNKLVMAVQNNAMDDSPHANILGIDEIFKSSKDDISNYVDVGILKLESSFAGPQATPIGLCNKNSIKKGDMVILYGWVEDAAGRLVSSQLKLSVIDNEACVNIYGKVFLNTMFCVADEKPVAFKYKTGGPAIVNGKFCGIYHVGPNYVDKKMPVRITSLAAPMVIRTISHALDHLDE